MVERLSVTIGSEEITFETGRIAKQAHGSILVTCGETMVLSAVCVASDTKPGQDFFPLTVDYREKSAAAGRIPGNFFRRESRPTEREVLVCRLTDRPLRPLFPAGFYNEVQVFGIVYSADNENNPDIMSINGASAALHISKIPFDGPIGAVRVGRIGGELVINPKHGEMAESDLDIVIAGTADAIFMVEGKADEVSEEVMLQALEFGHANIKKICACIEQLREKAGQPKMEFAAPVLDPTVLADVESYTEARFQEILKIAEKHPRQDAISALKSDVKKHLLEKYGEELFEERASAVSEAYDETEYRLMREQVIKTSTRIDGRALDQVRPITIEVGFLPRAHGSCLFTRGETQAIVTTTLGTSRDEQRLDELTGEAFSRFMLHYNFPSWSVGEVKRIAGPGRREVGHGKLAERALGGMVPVDGEGEETDAKPFPYTLRIVSDITESNGSSSMATVCGGSLSLMDAGVPIKAPVAGIAMGLIKEGDEARILSDILGAEDHLGDMDFKVCGTENGVTAFQMDIKIKGISSDLMKRALDQARQGRLHILGKMNECLSAPRPEISAHAPRIYTIKIDVDKIREVIGPGGKVIREIQVQTGAEIDVQDDGTINVAAVDAEGAQAAIDMIKSITASVEVGKIYHGTVTRIMNFGAFVSLIGNKEGMVHISELAPGRVGEVTDVLDIGDEVDVKVIEIDKMGRVNLSKVAADRELGRITGEDPGEGGERESRPPRDRGGDRHHGGGQRRPGGGGGGGRDRGRR
ncbi:MAG: polyribonucleotide nucleotidyltransferase [Candidatus Hydrogenedentes bacterium]|nr:polyribonucleotide nucleotidyltransferase [Candidatus Hydrogenedentota bacterium]